MAVIDLEDATIRLYEDPSLTDELTDTPARVLLQWGEGQLSLLAYRSQDEMTFEEEFKLLRRLMKSISRFTGRRQDMDEEEQNGYLSRIFEFAQQLGLRAPYEQINAYIELQKSLDEESNVRTLLSLVEIGLPNAPLY